MSLQRTYSFPPGVKPFTDSYPWPTLNIDLSLLMTLHRRVVASGNQYGLGDKVPIGADSSDVRGEDVDCSGYVRWLLHRATGEVFDIKDGSWIQHDFVKEIGFKRSTVQNATLSDNVLRIAFLAPGRIGRIGHVALILNGRTLESHSGTGPDSRQWNPKRRWMASSDVYVLTAPTIKEK